MNKFYFPSCDDLSGNRAICAKITLSMLNKMKNVRKKNTSEICINGTSRIIGASRIISSDPRCLTAFPFFLFL